MSKKRVSFVPLGRIARCLSISYSQVVPVLGGPMIKNEGSKLYRSCLQLQHIASITRAQTLEEVRRTRVAYIFSRTSVAIYVPGLTNLRFCSGCDLPNILSTMQSKVCARCGTA